MNCGIVFGFGWDWLATNTPRSFIITSAAVWPVSGICSPVDHNCYSYKTHCDSDIWEMHLLCFMHVSTGKLFQHACTSQAKSICFFHSLFSELGATVKQRTLRIIVNIIDMSPYK